MYGTALLAVALAALSASASPLSPRQSKYYGIGLHVDTNPQGEPLTASPAPVELNKLTSLGGVNASEIFFDDVPSNVDNNKVQCRAFSDADGVVPLGYAFTAASPVIFGQQPVPVGSVLCYVFED